MTTSTIELWVTIFFAAYGMLTLAKRVADPVRRARRASAEALARRLGVDVHEDDFT